MTAKTLPARDGETLPARDGETLPARVILSEAELRSSAERARRDLGRDGCKHDSLLCAKVALHSADIVPR